MTSHVLNPSVHGDGQGEVEEGRGLRHCVLCHTQTQPFVVVVVYHVTIVAMGMGEEILGFLVIDCVLRTAGIFIIWNYALTRLLRKKLLNYYLTLAMIILAQKAQLLC